MLRLTRAQCRGRARKVKTSYSGRFSLRTRRCEPATTPVTFTFVAGWCPHRYGDCVFYGRFKALLLRCSLLALARGLEAPLGLRLGLFDLVPQAATIFARTLLSSSSGIRGSSGFCAIESIITPLGGIGLWPRFPVKSTLISGFMNGLT